jgi:hypothetical protein
MPLASTVIVPNGKTPLFSECCVVCGQPCLGHTTVLHGGFHGWMGVRRWLLLQTPSVTVPAHPWCGSILKRRLLLHRVGLFFLSTAMIAVCLYLKLSLPFCLGAVILVTAPILIWEVLRPMEFDFVGTRQGMKFEFRDASYAHEFAKLNQVDIS